jgi:hypothetical protein
MAVRLGMGWQRVSYIVQSEHPLTMMFRTLYQRRLLKDERFFRKAWQGNLHWGG